MTIPRNLSNLAPGASSAGVLSAANGGTGANTLTANNVILGNGTSAVQFVAPGTSGNVLTSNGTTWASTAAAASGGGFTSIQVFTSSGTWTRPTGIKKIFIRGVGGGGAGGGSRAGSGEVASGGGAGGYFEKILDVTSISTVTITIGSKGNGVSALAGTDGGTTSFGSYASGNGGTGGKLGYSGGGSGGSATGGNINIVGQDGSIGVGSRNVPAGLGGSNLLGTGGAMIQTSLSGTGKVANGYGAGGGGASSDIIDGDFAGGNGTPGIIIVLEYT